MPGLAPFDACATILSAIAKRLGLESRLVELRLQRHWPQLVGEPIASHTWPAQIRFKKLYLTVQDSVWLQQLTFLKPTLLAKLKTEVRAESVAEIVLRVGEIPSQKATSAESLIDEPTSSLTEVARDEAARHATALQDPSLRERFTEVMSRYPRQAPPQPAKDLSRVP